MKRTILKTSPAELALLALMATLALAFLTGCGKPQYCEDLTTLQTAVKDLPSVATSKGVSGLESQLNTIESDAKALASSAKSDFPSESSAVESAVTQLKTSITSLPDKPSTSQIAAIGINASAVVNSVNAFTTAANDKCK